MSTKIGTVRSDGKIYAGSDYGYQSPATFNELKKKGEFKIGGKEVRRIASALKRYYQKNAPKPVKDAVQWYQDAPQRTQKRLEARGIDTSKPTYSPTDNSGPVDGTSALDATQKLLNKLSNKTNLHPMIVGGAAVLAETALTGKLGGSSAKRLGQNRLKQRLLNKKKVQPGEVMFHGTSDEAAEVITKQGFKSSDKVDGVFGEGVYSTPHDFYASAYANEAKYAAVNPNAEGILFQGKIPGGHRILDISDTNLTPKQLAKKIGEKNLNQWVQSKGYDGIKFKPSGKSDSLDEVLVFNPKLADQMYGTGIHSTGQPFPSQGSRLKQRPTPNWFWSC